MKDTDKVFERLAELFEPKEVKWKSQTVKGNRALAVAYVDARVIQDRLDDVLGPGNWQDEYEQLSDGAVLCKLSVRVDGEWIRKMDVGGPSEQPDGGDRTKAAFSDSLKRAAVKFGVGRYLYRLPLQWVEYDAQNRRFAKEPQLPASAIPQSANKPAASQPAAPKAAPAAPAPTPPQQQHQPAAQVKAELPKAPPNSPIDPKQVTEINNLLTKLQKPYTWLSASIEQRYGTTEVRNLKFGQAGELIAALAKMPPAQK